MNNIIRVLTLFSLSVIFASSCVSLTEEEKKFAASGKVTEVKSPAKAATLSILPGAGTLYLASEKDKPSGSKNHSLGGMAIVNWATWPVSIIWSMPQSYIDAKRINIKEAHYAHKQTQISKK